MVINNKEENYIRISILQSCRNHKVPHQVFTLVSYIHTYIYVYYFGSREQFTLVEDGS